MVLKKKLNGLVPPGPVEAIVIGASAGGIDALGKILPDVPNTYPVPIIIVLHLPSDQPSLLSAIFAAKVHLLVKEAEEKEAIQPGIIYFAPPGYHLLVEPDRTFSLSLEAAVQFARPSIDVLFESAADAYGKQLIGVLLTGANEDGARGLKKIEEMGGLVLIQDPATADAPSMPAAGIQRVTRKRVLSLAELRDFLIQLDLKSHN